MEKHIYPIFDRMLQRNDREKLLGQKGIMLWFTGLSGSGKSTLAIALERELYNSGILCRILDGDNIRTGINNNLGFTEADRVENIRRIAEVAKLFVDCGVVTIAAFISPTEQIRQMAGRYNRERRFFRNLCKYTSGSLRRKRCQRVIQESPTRRNKKLYRHIRSVRSATQSCHNH